MELRQLETFQIVMSTLNMTVAAEKIHLSPAAVSLQLRNLSDELGVELFCRSGRKLVPTAAARRLATHITPLMNVLRAIREDFPADAMHDTRPFVLATGVTTLIYQLRAPLSRIRERFAKNDIQVRIGTTEFIVEGLESMQFDLGIVSLPLDRPSLRLRPLFREEMLLVMKAGGAGFRQKSITLAQLQQIPLVLYPIGTNTRMIIDRFSEKYKLRLRVTMELDNTEAIKKMVEAGFGASILPETALQGVRMLRKVRIEGVSLYREIALAELRSAYTRSLTTAISDYLIEELGKVGGLKPTVGV